MTTPDFPLWTLIPFAASALLFGLPHGALDHLVCAKIFCPSKRPRWTCWGLIIGAYLGLSAVGLILWLGTPEWAFAAFIGLTWYHWGQGELEAAHRLRPDLLGNAWHRATYLLWRGSQPMLLPLAAQPDVYSQVAEACMMLFGRPDSVLPGIIRQFGPLALVAGFGLWLVEKAAAPRQVRWHRLKLMLDLLLSALFLLGHPIFTVGIYFLCWHAPLHMERLRHFLADPHPLSWVGVFGLATPLTILTLLAILGIGFFAASLEVVESKWLALYLVSLSCLTWPHAIVVTLQDTKDRVWSASEARRDSFSLGNSLY